MPSSSRHSGAIRLAPIANAMCSSWAARASAPGEVAGVGAQRHPAPGPGRPRQAASARRSRSGAVARGSSVPEPRSAASTISVSAQAATCGRPARWPWWLYAMPRFLRP